MPMDINTEEIISEKLIISLTIYLHNIIFHIKVKPLSVDNIDYFIILHIINTGDAKLYEISDNTGLTIITRHIATAFTTLDLKEYKFYIYFNCDFFSLSV